jgi:hypothetical protein
MTHPFDREALCWQEKLRQLVGLVGNKSDPQFGSDLCIFFFFAELIFLGMRKKGMHN